MTHVLVTGGAGYIGSHACKALRAAGYIPVAYDNLSTGWADAVKFGPLERGDLTDRARLDRVFETYRPRAILHFAALNLGTGTGFSVREVIDQSAAVTNRPVPVIEGPRRAGDCTRLVSGSTRAEAELGWRPARSTLAQMIGDAWRWHQTGHYNR